MISMHKNIILIAAITKFNETISFKEVFIKIKKGPKAPFKKPMLQFFTIKLELFYFESIAFLHSYDDALV